MLKYEHQHQKSIENEAGAFGCAVVVCGACPRCWGPGGGARCSRGDDGAWGRVLGVGGVWGRVLGVWFRGVRLGPGMDGGGGDWGGWGVVGLLGSV
jgi:hypothetical protein